MFEEVSIASWKLLVLSGLTVGGVYSTYRWARARLALAELARRLAPGGAVAAWLPTYKGELTRLIAFRFDETEIVPMAPEKEVLERIFGSLHTTVPEDVVFVRVALLGVGEEEG